MYYFCDALGCYECVDLVCYEIAPGDIGDSCKSDFECEKGTVCNDGTCDLTDTCRADSDCLATEYCAEDRRTCTPKQECVYDEDCAGGLCDLGLCHPAEICGPDGSCADGLLCDHRNLCVPADRIAMCQAPLTQACTADKPACIPGTSAAIVNGCYTGECVENGECPDDNPCAQNTRPECADDQNAGRCAMIFRGLNCKSPSGAACDIPSATCTCESFVFEDCVAVSQ
jgi:hypothetical protein